MSYRRDRHRSRGVGAVDALDDRRYPGAAAVSYSRDAELSRLTRGMSLAEGRALQQGRLQPVISGRASTARIALAGTGKGGKPSKPGAPTPSTPSPPSTPTGGGGLSRILRRTREVYETQIRTPVNNPPPPPGGTPIGIPSGAIPAGSRQTTPYTPESIAEAQRRRAAREAAAAAKRAAEQAASGGGVPASSGGGGGGSGGGGGGSSSGGGGGGEPLPDLPAIDVPTDDAPITTVAGFKVTPTVLAIAGAGAVGLFLLMRRRR